MASKLLIDSDKPLFTILSYLQPPLLPLRAVNKTFKDKLEAYKNHRQEESKVSHEVVMTTEAQSSQVYLKMRDLIINPRVNNKVRTSSFLELYRI
jgi:hypothetical protein